MNFFIFFFMILASLAFAALGATVKVLGHLQISLALVLFSRFFVSLISYLPAYLKHRPPLFGQRPGLMLARIVLGITATQASFYAALHIKLGNASLLTLTAPLFTFLLAPILLGENIQKKKWLWLLVAVVGVLALSHVEKNDGDLWGLLAGLASGLLAAVSYMVIRKLHETESFLSISFTYSLFATIITGLSVLVFFQPTQIGFDEIKFLFLCGLIATFYQGIYTYSLRHNTASTLAPLLYLSVIFSFGIGFYYFGESVTAINIFGVILIMLGLLKLSPAK